MKINTAEIGNRIKAMRINKHYTRAQLAELVGISDKFLYEVEVGRKNFSAYVLCNFAEAFYVTCEYIMFGSDSEKYSTEIAVIFDSFEEESIDNIIEILRIISKISLKK